MKKDLTGAELIIDFLDANGFRDVFGIPGRRILPLYDAAYRNGNIKMIVSQHEQGGAYMAECYSQLTGKGCCVGISGPGAMNLLNGVAAAYADSVPMLVIGGQARIEDYGKYAIQESTGIGRTPNQLKLFEAVTKWSRSVPAIEALPALLREAYLSMNAGRKGPVYLEVPTNVLHEVVNVDTDDLRVEVPTPANRARAEDEHEIVDVLTLLNASKRPLLLLGNGAVLANAEFEARELVEFCAIPYASTLPAKGILAEDDPCSLGCVGIWGQAAANQYMLQHADLLIAVGTTFQELSTLGWRTIVNKKIVRVDIDPSEIRRNCEPDLAIVQDAKTFLQALVSRARLGDVLKDRFANCAPLLDDLRATHGYYESYNLAAYDRIETGKLKIFDVLIELGKMRGREDILVLDVGENSYFSEFLIKSYAKRTYLTNAGLGSMGFSVAGAVGASFAAPAANVISITGGGGFLMNCNELATASHYGRKVVWCVFNNGILGTQKHFQRDFCDGRYIGSDVPNVDLVKLANSFGVDASTVETMAQFREVFERALTGDRSHLLNIVIDETVKPLPPFSF